MKKILEAILAINLAVLFLYCIYKHYFKIWFSDKHLSVDELSRYLFVWLTFIGAIVAFSWIAPTFRSPFWWRSSPPHGSDGVALGYPFLNLIYLWRTGLGATLKTIQDWSDYFTDPRFTHRPDVCRLFCPPASLHRILSTSSFISTHHA